MAPGRKVDPFYDAHFTVVAAKDDKSKRRIYSCNYCDANLEHRDNRLASHLAGAEKCKKAPATARTGAHILMAAKKSGKRAAPDSESDESPEMGADAVATVIRAEPSSSKPPKKKQKQSSLDSVVDRPMNTAQTDSANRKLLRYFIHSNTAFVNADNIFLADFTNEIRPSFNIASRSTMSTLFLDSDTVGFISS